MSTTLEVTHIDLIRDRLQQQTGRRVGQRKVECSMCDGQGWSMFEDPCEACAGERETLEWVFIDCGHRVESEDCQEEGCIEPCEVFVDLGVKCGRPITQTVTEPFTPRAFKILCCDQCAKDFREQGYGWIAGV